MLESVNELTRECRQHAKDCARKAAAVTDPKLKKEFLDVEQRWLRLLSTLLASIAEFERELIRPQARHGRLVRGYEFTERLKDRSDDTERRADMP